MAYIRFTRLFSIVLLAGIVLAFSACSSNSKREFNRLVVQLADNDQTIDNVDWKKITTFLQNNKTQFSSFYLNGKLNEKAVKEYIIALFENRRPSKTVRFTFVSDEKLSFHIYVERSASMIPYDSPQGDGSFRSVIMDVENRIPGNYTIDSIGETGYTDFHKIFNDLLNKTSGNVVNVLFTDMIYSVKSMDGVNPQKVFNEARQMVNAVFKDEVKNKSMLIIRLDGSYNGPYYAYDNSAHEYSGKRPYYMVIVTSNENMLRLTSDDTLKSFADFHSLRGFSHSMLFTADDLYSPYASFLLNNKDAYGRYRPERTQENGILSLHDISPEGSSKEVQLALAVDLSRMPVDQSYLMDINNYQVESDDNIRLKKIRKIEKADRTPAEKKYIGSATHLFIFTVSNLTHGQKVSVRLLNRMPSWITSGSCDDDHVPTPDQTFGLRYLLQGIYDSYAKNIDGKPAYFTLRLELDN